MEASIEKEFISELEKEKLIELNKEQEQLLSLNQEIGNIEVRLIILKNQSAQTTINHEQKIIEFRNQLHAKYGNVNISNDGEIVPLENQVSE